MACIDVALSSSANGQNKTVIAMPAIDVQVVLFTVEISSIFGSFCHCEYVFLSSGLLFFLFIFYC